MPTEPTGLQSELPSTDDRWRQKFVDEVLDYRKTQEQYLSTLPSEKAEQIKQYFHFFLAGRPKLELNEPETHLDQDCQYIATTLEQIVERNSQLQPEVAKKVFFTFGQLFGDTVFDFSSVAKGVLLYHDVPPQDKKLRIVPDYIPAFEENRVINIPGNYTNNESLHPQTIGNLVGMGGLVDIVRVTSFDFRGSESILAFNRMKAALTSMGITIRQNFFVNFPNHGGDDAYFYQGGPNYNTSIEGPKVSIIDKVPLVVVQDDYGKGKFFRYAVNHLHDAGFFEGRTVFSYIVMYSKPNFVYREPNEITFLQISQVDKGRISGARPTFHPMHDFS